MDDASDVCRIGNKVKQDKGQPRTIMKERSSGRNCGWQHATMMAAVNAALTESEGANLGKPVWFRRASEFFRSGQLLNELVNFGLAPGASG
jgi:hypothetical protein